MKITLLILLTLLYEIHPNCFGVPLKAFGGRDDNCFSLCCAEGFVQDIKTGLTCISCDSVGLIQCVSCSLYRTIDNKNVYKCLSSKNINHLVTVGTASKCTNLQGFVDNTYILSNWTNFDKCLACS